MEKIKIITDSTSDLSKDIVEKYNIEVLPLIVNFGEESYYDGVDMTFDKLIAKIKEGVEFPTTSQINPQRFYDCFKENIEDGYKIIYIGIGSKFSGTYQSACIARDMLSSEDIVIIDSENVTSGLGILVIYAGKLMEQGMNLKEIEKEILECIPKVDNMLAFNSLEHLIKGGRLSKTAGFIGNVLSIKPMLAIRDGEIGVIDKVRGTKKAIKAVTDYLEDKKVKQGTPVILLEAPGGDMKKVVLKKLQEKDFEVIEQKVGCVVGTHSGPDAVGVFFIKD
ncbi:MULTISPECIES: DegV family protein [Clostridium]|uniref:DegV family protein n=1 Tax=Clostridium cadaveris TaxID=1529 RepID=A0A1I2KHQ5_9CLOT|nr:DegV family protein [Clostridium cadaveris]MDU4952089.1 DegV family protein [Clostridium sp.]MDM8310594.1 DegV family protein [Clostridium cadaveris]MDY4949682.1 DegV family protein [Clostridium cadaveris]NME65145.1 DegV family protein [Clostridium cadaveris]NWK11397.1 DegV family protein [Clostridium cadaveris]